MRVYNGVVAMALIVVLLVVTVAPAWAIWRVRGAGGCGDFPSALADAEPGDVIAPMRGGISTGVVPVTKSVVIQGGWVPDTGDCNSSGTNLYADAAALDAAGFVYDPTQRSELFGDNVAAVLPIDLTAGQTTVLQNLEVSFQSANRNGIAISGTISNSARLRLENLRFESNQAGVNGTGGAIFLEVRGNSQLVIADSEFVQNNAVAGGALEVRLYDNSTLLIENSTFTQNNALTGNGGALRVQIERGAVTLHNNTFTENATTNGSGGAVALERAPGASGPATALLNGNTFSANTAVGAPDVYTDGVILLEPQLYLPALRGAAPPPLSAQIMSIALDEARYRVAFTTSGFTPQLPGQHVHFFFNTVPPEQAGVPGSGPWAVYGGASPFSGYDIADRPPGATHLCILVANPNHSVIQGTGNCTALP
jgi:hypothetical protein